MSVLTNTEMWVIVVIVTLVTGILYAVYEDRILK